MMETICTLAVQFCFVSLFGDIHVHCSSLMVNTMTQAMAGVIALSSWLRHHFVSTLPCAAQVSKRLLVKFYASGQPLDGLQRTVYT